jgi:hypothetical protein
MDTHEFLTLLSADLLYMFTLELEVRSGGKKDHICYLNPV